MPALNFQARFAPLVESGEKRQTIRACRKDGRDPKVGDTLYLYTGQRTKACRKLGEAVCIDRFHVFIDWHTLEIDNRPCDAVEADEIARMDGLPSWTALAGWIDHYHGLPFDGFMFRW